MIINEGIHHHDWDGKGTVEVVLHILGHQGQDRQQSTTHIQYNQQLFEAYES